ncbi:MAG: ATP-binding domain-containing protein, partial [Bacteroidia bacterium]|nr:ATP-binding domain-containing protein [Bacteroidia bacterium]
SGGQKENNVVICRSNKRANIYNREIRRRILFLEEEISTGDYLMVVKNNYFWMLQDENAESGIEFIANGDIVQLVKIRKYTERYGFRFAEVTIRLIDYGNLEIDTVIMLDTLNSETPSLPAEENKRLFSKLQEEYQSETRKRKRLELIFGDIYFNALQVKYAYAITCHKAQGGQWNAVLVDQGYLSGNSLSLEYLRWLYTAITRPVEKLYLINFREDFF